MIDTVEVIKLLIMYKRKQPKQQVKPAFDWSHKVVPVVGERENVLFLGAFINGKLSASHIKLKSMGTTVPSDVGPFKYRQFSTMKQ